jgi:phosphoesterase RecJ-like protein
MALPKLQRDQATELIARSERILVIPHDNVDPDGLTSALAVGTVLLGAGKDVCVACPGEIPKNLSFLPGYTSLRSPERGRDLLVTLSLPDGTDVEKLRYTVEDRRLKIIVTPSRGSIPPDRATVENAEPPYDLLVIVDTADLSLLGSFAQVHRDLLEEVFILNIDHHISNTGFGQVQLIDPTAASTTEILAQWFLQDQQYRDYVNPDVATLLLAGLIADTRSFQNPNTTPQSLEVAAGLLERGARQQEIVRHIYKTKPLSTLKIWGRALKNLQVDSRNGIVWSAISREDLREMGAKSNETHGIIDELFTTLPEADLFVLFTELEEGGLKASMRTTEALDASAIAGQAYGGGGHARSAGFRVRTYDQFALQVLECVKKLQEEIRRQRAEAIELPKAEATIPLLRREEAVMEGGQAVEGKGATFIDVVEEISREGTEGVKGTEGTPAPQMVQGAAPAPGAAT